MTCPRSDYVYVWVDGVHFSIRLEDARLCALVIVGVRTDGRKELVAICDGYRESSDSWSALLHDLRRRGMRAPVLACGDGALGFWKALREVFPETKEQRDWVHKGFNVLAALPASHQPLAKKMLAEIRDAEDRDHARHAAKAFIAEFEGRWPKAADKIRRRSRRALVLLRLPPRALGAPEDDEPDRVDLLAGAREDARHQGCRLENRRAGDGLQAHRGRVGTLEVGEQPASRCSRSRRSEVQKGGVGRARPARSGSRCVNQRGSSTTFDDCSMLSSSGMCFSVLLSAPDTLPR